MDVELVVSAMLLTFAIVANAGRWNSSFIQKTEAEHFGDPSSWSPPTIVKEFRSFLTAASLLGDSSIDDMDLHHELVTHFCRFKKFERCTWAEYQAMYDELRTPFAKVYDPKPTLVFSVSDLRKRGQILQDCSRLNRFPSSKEFLDLVQLSKPIVFDGAARAWPAVSKWTYQYLSERLGAKHVVASVSPNGYFDAPEDSKRWGRQKKKGASFNATEDIVIARPGHISVSFRTFVELLQDPERKMGTSLYLEYFPLHALSKVEQFCYNTTKSCGTSILEDVENLDFANFLFPRHRLFWMGSGKTVGALHFDRNENLMVVLRGKKRFLLIHPEDSDNVYGSTKLRSASYDASYNAKTGKLSIRRSRHRVVDTPVTSVYSPLNISGFNMHHFPKASKVKPIICEVNEGDVIYVPAQWWHEVESIPDHEGKTIGINFFYEPMWTHLHHNVSSNVGVQNRYYNYILPGNASVALACEDEYVCFHENDSESEKEL